MRFTYQIRTTPFIIRTILPQASAKLKAKPTTIHRCRVCTQSCREYQTCLLYVIVQKHALYCIVPDTNDIPYQVHHTIPPQAPVLHLEALSRQIGFGASSLTAVQAFFSFPSAISGRQQQGEGLSVDDVTPTTTTKKRHQARTRVPCMMSFFCPPARDERMDGVLLCEILVLIVHLVNTNKQI